MVKISLFLLFALTSISLCAQTDTTEKYSVTFVSEPPCYKVDENGENNPNYNFKKLKQFIGKNINYSEISETILTKEVVYISLWIDTLGNTYGHKVIRGVCKSLNIEALRVAKLIKFEKPAKQRGKSIKVKYTVPVEFKLFEGDKKSKCKKQ